MFIGLSPTSHIGVFHNFTSDFSQIRLLPQAFFRFRNRHEKPHIIQFSKLVGAYIQIPYARQAVRIDFIGRSKQYHGIFISDNQKADTQICYLNIGCTI